MVKKTLLALILFTAWNWGQGQEAVANKDSSKRDFQRFDIFPAISYAPETKLTLGVIGYYYMDLARDDPSTLLSNINFLAVYTTAKQIAIESRWEIITNANKWRFRGEVYYNKWPDRNYGRGNDPTSLVLSYNNDELPEEVETHNYLAYTSDRILFAPVVLRKVTKYLYVGAQADLEYLFNARPIKDQNVFLNADSTRITGLPVAGLRSSLGVLASWDSRDYVLNPIKGSFITLGTLHYLNWLGSDFTYHSLRLDARHYFNPVSNHTLAIRALWNFRFSDDPIPIRGLSRVGGRDFMRGYFIGTYQDNHLGSFEVEYRLPLWKEDGTAPLIQFWKRLGISFFAGTAQVASTTDEFGFNRFHSAAGAGLRILFNRDSRSCLRLDYAVGLDPNANGPGKRQTGFYFFLGEAF